MPTGKQHQHGSVFMGMLMTVAVMLMEVGTLWEGACSRLQCVSQPICY